MVSVRSAAEAEQALAGGAALIDVKEPARGSLGRADDEVIAAVTRAVAGRCPVSAALGEWRQNAAHCDCPGLSFVKWGLSGCRSIDWRSQLSQAGAQLVQATPECRPVAAAYADWRRADSPTPEAVADFACAERWGAFLLDTWNKQGGTLLDWLDVEEIVRLSRRCRQAGVRVALAGSLGPDQIERLRIAAPDWFAVRGSVCGEGKRDGAIRVARVRSLAALVQSS